MTTNKAHVSKLKLTGQKIVVNSLRIWFRWLIWVMTNMANGRMKTCKTAFKYIEADTNILDYFSNILPDWEDSNGITCGASTMDQDVPVTLPASGTLCRCEWKGAPWPIWLEPIVDAMVQVSSLNLACVTQHSSYTNGTNANSYIPYLGQGY